MLRRLSSIRTALPFIGGLLLVLSLSSALGCSAPQENLVPTIPIPTGTGEGEDAKEPVPSVLDPARTLNVEVRGPTGEPVGGASVFALHAAALDPAALVLSSRVTGDRARTLKGRATWRGLSSEDGRVLIPMAGDRGCLIAVEAGELYGEAEYGGSGGEGLEMTLASRRSVEIRVLNDDGTPAAGVALTVRAEDSKGALQALPITSVTGSDGAAVLYVPRGGAAGLEVMARLAMVDPQRVSLAGGNERTIQLPPMGSYEIEVRGHPTFQGPVAGLAQVFAASDGSRSSTTLAVPIVAGRAIVPRVPAGVALRLICAVADGDRASEILANQSVPIPAVAAGETGQARVSFRRYERVGRKLELR